MTILDIRQSDQIAPLLREQLGENEHDLDKALRTYRKKDGNLIRVEITTHEITFNSRPAEIVRTTIPR